MCRIEYADDYDSMWLRGGSRRANKTHECQDCTRTIAKGEDYHFAVFINDGDLEQYKMCAHCAAAAKWLDAVCGGWLWNGVIEELREHWDEEHDLRSVGLGRLVACGERRWRSRRARGATQPGELFPLEDVRRWCEEAIARVPEEALH